MLKYNDGTQFMEDVLAVVRGAARVVMHCVVALSLCV